MGHDYSISNASAGSRRSSPFVRNLFSFCVCSPPCVAARSVPRFWVPVTQRAFPPSVFSQIAQLLFKPEQNNNTGNDTHRFCLSVTQMCWNVPTQKLCFVMNPVHLCVGHQTEDAQWFCRCEPARSGGSVVFLLCSDGTNSEWWAGDISIFPLLAISQFKATSGCVLQPAPNFLSLVLIGSFHSAAITVKRSHGARLEDIFSGFWRHTVMSEVRKVKLLLHVLTFSRDSSSFLLLQRLDKMFALRGDGSDFAPPGKVMKRLRVPRPSFCLPSRTWTRFHRWHTQTNYTVLSDSDFIRRPIHVKPAFQKQGHEKRTQGIILNFLANPFKMKSPTFWKLLELRHY